MPIDHARYIKILTWFQGFRVKSGKLSSLFYFSIPKRNLDAKKTTPDIEVCPESLGAIIFASQPLPRLRLERSLSIIFLIWNHDGSDKAMLWNPTLVSLGDIDEVSKTEIF